MLQHVLQVNMLLDFYASLLTKRQQAVLKYYYSDDLSLGEIAENEGISRQGIHDLIKRGESSLHDYEAKLGLVQRFHKQSAIIREVQEELQGLVTADNRQSIAKINKQLGRLLI